LIALTVVCFALSYAALSAIGNPSSGVREDRGNRWVIGTFEVTGLVAGFSSGLDRPEGILNSRRR
jgi:hypothetical protein